MKESETLNTRVMLGDDGKYRWTYEMSLFKNPTIFLLILKIFFFIFLGVFAVVNISDFIKWGAEKVPQNLPILGYLLLGITAVVGLGYLIYAAIMGGKYIVEFEMDEKGITHKQTASQARKAKKLGRATMIAGAASGRIGIVGAGMNAQRTEMYSDFSKVRKIKAYPRRDLIKVNERFGHNQVYAAKEDFEFVKNYIASRCVNIKQ
ncbi:MAG: hypothetical protein IJJ40_01785 [Clostridia bacterium]|nr:hypothetical protein [Clostridia bacterium]